MPGISRFLPASRELVYTGVCVCTCTHMGEGQEVCVWVSVSEEVEQARTPDHFHLSQKWNFRLACPWLRLAVRNRTQGRQEVRGTQPEVAQGREMSAGLHRGCSCGRAEKRHCHGSGWGQKC